MASLGWTDTTGSATLNTQYPAPGNRFRNWVPRAMPFGEGAHGLGDGVRYIFEFRVDYGAAFEFPGIANTDVDLALRLQAHLLRGGEVSVSTGDTSGNTYTQCGLAPDGEVTLELSDTVMLEYTLRLDVINVAAVPVPLLCEY